MNESRPNHIWIEEEDCWSLAVCAFGKWKKVLSVSCNEFGNYNIKSMDHNFKVGHIDSFRGMDGFKLKCEKEYYKYICGQAGIYQEMARQWY